MIDISAETVLSFAAATKFIPARRAGKKPHVATLYRWAASGLRGVRLECIQVGGTLCTSVQALQRFFEQLTQQGTGRASNIASSRAQLVERAIEGLRKKEA